MMFRRIAVAALSGQMLSFFVLGAYFISTGRWKLGVAQFLLAGVTGLVYSEGL